MSTALGNRDIRSAYAKLVLALLVLTILLGSAMVYGIWELTAFADPTTADGQANGDIGSFAAISMEVLRWVGVVLVIIAAPVLSVILLGLLLPVFAEAIFLAALQVLDPARAQALRAQRGISILSSLAITVGLLFYFLLWTLVAIVVSFVPLIGPFLAPVVQLLAAAKIIGWELMSPYFDKHRMNFTARRHYVNGAQAAILGFGLPCSFLLAIPLLGPLCFGLAQAASPTLLVRVLESQPTNG